MKILAAIDNSYSARPILEVAAVLARQLRAEVHAVHVREDGAVIAQEIARALQIPLRIVEAKPLEQLVAELDEPDAALAVVGTRRNEVASRPVGRLAMTIIEHSAKPVVVVPIEEGVCVSRELKRLLVPLDATEATARAAKRALVIFAGSGIEVVALHVFDSKTVPRFLDRPEHDVTVWTREFLARYCSAPGTRIQLRRGQAGTQVISTAEEEGVDMIALGWAQNLSTGHAAVVREVLANSCVPVMLIPTEPSAAKELTQSNAQSAS